jgi:hypothetical protein
MKGAGQPEVLVAMFSSSSSSSYFFLSCSGAVVAHRPSGLEFGGAGRCLGSSVVRLAWTRGHNNWTRHTAPCVVWSGLANKAVACRQRRNGMASARMTVVAFRESYIPML